MSEDTKKKILTYVARGLKPPGIAHSQAVILWDFSVLIRIIMKDQTTIFGWLDPQDNLWMLDEYEWLYKGGLQILAHERDIKTVEIND
jgi:hypothetical protein